MAAIKEVNEREDDDNIMIGSADVNALYPSLDIDHTANIVGTKFHESNIDIEGINADELGLYIALNLDTNEIKNLEINDYCPTRKTNRGRPPNMTGCATKGDKTEDRFKPWNKKKQAPTEDQLKKMLSIAIEIAIKQIMRTHIYEFEGELRKQLKGGPIGLELTGDIAQIYMIWYDDELKKKITENGLNIKMYKRYVDDINIVLRIPPTEERTEGNRNEEDQEDITITTMNKVREIGGTIHESIKLQIDTPKLNKDLKMPILDLKVWCERRKFKSPNNTTTEKNIVLHEFYAKPISSKNTMHARTAFPTKTKRTTLTQEMLRVLLRCSPELEWEETAKHCNELTKRMQFSGYDQAFRTLVTVSALKAYKEIQRKDKEGIEPMYRKKEWNRETRDIKKREKQEKWYKTKGEESVIFIPATPKSELKNRVEQTVKERKLNIRVVEKGGTPIKNILKRSKQKDINNVCNCLVCTSGGKPGACRKEGAIYEIKCKECQSSYIGETGRNAYTRINEHLHDAADPSKHKHSVLHRHIEEKHNNKDVTYDATVLQSFPKSAMRRQIAESIHINKSQHSINNCTEWNHHHVTQLTVTRGAGSDV